MYFNVMALMHMRPHEIFRNPFSTGRGAGWGGRGHLRAVPCPLREMGAAAADGQGVVTRLGGGQLLGAAAGGH